MVVYFQHVCKSIKTKKKIWETNRRGAPFFFFFVTPIYCTYVGMRATGGSGQIWEKRRRERKKYE